MQLQLLKEQQEAQVQVAAQIKAQHEQKELQLTSQIHQQQMVDEIIKQQQATMKRWVWRDAIAFQSIYINVLELWSWFAVGNFFKEVEGNTASWWKTNSLSHYLHPSLFLFSSLSVSVSLSGVLYPPLLPLLCSPRFGGVLIDVGQSCTFNGQDGCGGWQRGRRMCALAGKSWAGGSPVGAMVTPGGDRVCAKMGRMEWSWPQRGSVRASPWLEVECHVKVRSRSEVKSAGA